MAAIPNISFNVRFNLTGTPTLVLTDATALPPSGFVGIFSITQPDGYTRTGNISAPDISSGGGAFSIALRLDSTGEVQTGTYTIKYTCNAPGYLSTDFTRTFEFQYKPVELKLTQDFDVFTPALKFKDDTVYQVSNYNATTVTRAWSATSVPTGTVTSAAQVFDIKYNNKYYDAYYTITLASTLTYTHQTYTYLTVQETITKAASTFAQTPPSLDQIVSKISALKTTLDGLVNTNQPYVNAKADFEFAQVTFAHIIDKLKVYDTANLQRDLTDLLAVLNNYQTVYTPTNAQISPYDYTNFTGASKWGKIGGNLSDQTDLWAYIQTFIKHDNFVFDQPSALISWTIVHNMGKYPSVTIVDTAGDEVEGEVRHNSNNQITITFSAPVAGKAYLN